MQAVIEKNVSYDLSKFDRRVSAKEKAEKARTAAKAKSRTRVKSGISGFSVFCGVVVFCMLIALLYSYVNLTEVSDINMKRQNELESLREDVQMLEISKNQRMGALQIRDWATTRLGMSKIDKSQITYVTTSGGDRFEIGDNKPKETSKLIAGLAKGFSTVIEYIN